MITLRPFYEDDLLEDEMYLAMQEYWDDLGSYWSDCSVEKKIIMMGRVLIHGGKLEDVIDYKIYPLADNDTPKLAADRMEYNFSCGLNFFRVWELDKIKEAYDNIVITKIQLWLNN